MLNIVTATTGTIKFSIREPRFKLNRSSVSNVNE